MNFLTQLDLGKRQLSVTRTCPLGKVGISHALSGSSKAIAFIILVL
ncbi:MAG: hypothetical protein V7K47_32270 [Nostoc sp.]